MISSEFTPEIPFLLHHELARTRQVDVLRLALGIACSVIIISSISFIGLSLQTSVSKHTPAPASSRFQAQDVSLAITPSRFKEQPLQTPISSASLLQLTNKLRAYHHLSLLMPHISLEQAAEQRAQEILHNQQFSHFSSTSTQDTPSAWHFIESAQYDYVFAGENLARGYDTSEDVLVVWIKSKTHRANLLNTHFYDCGFAVVRGVLGGREVTLVVALFGEDKQTYEQQVREQLTCQNCGREPENPQAPYQILEQ